MTQKQYRNIDRYQDLLNRIAPSRLVEQTRHSVIGHEGSLEAFVTSLSFEVNRCVMLARGVDPSRPWRTLRGSSCSYSMSPP